MFVKLGEQFQLTAENIQTPIAVLSDPEIHQRFEKLAKELKKIAPKSEDFLYFTTRFITAAEAALINEDGSPKLDREGKPITAHWEKIGDGVKWVCSDLNIKPFKNNNSDIFPESELLKAIPKWAGKGLFIDHQSGSVENLRGIILDTYYDAKNKCGLALVALDRATHPDLAHKVKSGYSTSISMGTRVGLAICSECHQACRSEKDFCQHMRAKSCYGEINLECDPIEISLVVSPADPTAKIRTVFASYQNIKSHQYSSDTQERIKELQNNLWKLGEQFRELRDLALDEEKAAKSAENKSETEIEPPYGQSSGSLAMPADETDPGALSTVPTTKYADINALVSELKILKASMEKALQELLTQPNKEDTMSDNSNMNKKEAYWFGGGGVNEPTPHKVKYPIDPGEGQARKEDKQMVGQPPFPEVGDVEGLHPSPSSVDVKDELKRKEMLLRAEDERIQRRKNALEQAKANLAKNSYWLGGGGVNEPTPGKVKYPIDPMAGQARKEDKPMVGQSPFPDVGDVEGLHPSPASAEPKDELERKKMLLRASLKAAFHKASNLDGTLDCDNSGWRVYAKDNNNEKLIFTASVKELSGNRSEALYDMIATKDFGSKMLDKIRSVGLEKAASMLKSAQALTVPAGTEVNPTGGVAGMPADTGGASPVPAMDTAVPAAATETEDTGAKGDPKETALKLAEKMRDDASDLLEAVRLLTGEGAEMSELEQGIQALPKSASNMLDKAAKMRRQLHGMHISAAKKSLAELKEHYEELKLIAETADGEVIKNASISKMIATAFEEAQQARQEAQLILRSYARYAAGVDGLETRVKEAKESTSNDESCSSEEDSSSANDGAMSASDSSCSSDMHMAEDFDLENFEKELETESPEGEDFEDETSSPDDLDLLPEDHKMEESLMADDVNQMNDGGTVVELPAGQPVPPGAKTIEMKQASFDLSTKEGRTAYRAKLAKDLGEVEDVAKLKWNPVLHDANRLANGQTKLDTKPSDDLGLVETLPEVQKCMMEVAKAPPKVRKEAETLNQLIAQGAVHPSQLDQLVAEGLDSEVVKYWRNYYGQAGKEGSEFGKLLTTETMQAKAKEEMETYKIKLARAYDLANEMVRRGLIADTQTAIAHQVEETMKWNDEAYESMKRVVAKHLPSMRKEASMPQVGMIGTGDPMVSAVGDLDLQAQLDQAFAGRRY